MVNDERPVFGDDVTPANVDHHLIGALSAGGVSASKAIELAYDLYARKLLGRLYKRYPSCRSDAEDCVQHAFMNLWRVTRDQSRVVQSSLEAYLWTSMDNRMKDIIRSRPPETADVPDEPQEPIEGGTDDCLRVAIGRFLEERPLWAEALGRQAEGETISAVAAWLGRTERAATQFLYNARNLLAGMITELCGDQLVFGYEDWRRERE